MYEYRTLAMFTHRPTLWHEHRVDPSERLTTPTAMRKHPTPQTQGFGLRLAELRKSAGYTQQELADEIGASRRQIAYYEGESEHPPANLLIDLARALNVSTDALLGRARIARSVSPPCAPDWSAGSN